jgi:RNA recognition motif-containing protein
MFFEKDNMNIYVGNIPWSTSEEELEAHFAQYGNVNAVRIITEGHSGRSKGFGFVEMETKEAGQAAIEALDGNDFGGRDLRVNEAKPRD